MQLPLQVFKIHFAALVGACARVLVVAWCVVCTFGAVAVVCELVRCASGLVAGTRGVRVATVRNCVFVCMLLTMPPTTDKQRRDRKTTRSACAVKMQLLRACEEPKHAASLCAKCTTKYLWQLYCACFHVYRVSELQQNVHLSARNTAACRAITTATVVIVRVVIACHCESR